MRWFLVSMVGAMVACTGEVADKDTGTSVVCDATVSGLRSRSRTRRACPLTRRSR